jgi:rod shape-determining protein MreD
MAARPMTPQELLLPVKPGFIILTLVAALLANLLPWSGWAQWLVPDFVALVVLYWCIEEPRKIGFLAAWSLGLLMDIAEGSLFGQHALAYSILAYAGIALHRRVQRFSLAPQILHVIPLLLFTDLVALLVRVLAGADFPGYAYFLGSFTGAALWPVLYYLLKLPQRPRPDPDRV